MKRIIFGLVVATAVAAVAQPKPQQERREAGASGDRKSVV